MTPTLEGQTALIIGGTKGIGKETARGLAQQGAHVVIVGRDPHAGASTAHDLGPNVTFIPTDVSLMTEVRRLATAFQERHDRLDMLIHSADVLRVRRETTSEGFEVSFATNYLSRVLLNHLLLDLLRASSPARIIHIAAAGMPGRLNLRHFPPAPNVSSMTGHTVGQRANDVYGVELAERERANGITVNVLNPGLVDTDIRRAVPGLMGDVMRVVEFAMRPSTKTPEAYAHLPISLAASPELARASGILIGMNGRPLPTAKHDPDTRRRLWTASEALLGLSDPPRPSASPLTPAPVLIKERT